VFFGRWPSIFCSCSWCSDTAGSGYCGLRSPGISRNALVCRAHEFLSIFAFKASYGEMAARNCLKMLNKGIIDRGAPKCTNDRYRLSGNLLRYDNPKSCTDLSH
jgi:hypothetical protein